MADHPLPAHGTRARYVSKVAPCHKECCRAPHRLYMTRYRNQWLTRPSL